MSNGKAAKRLNALANSLRVSLRPLCSGMYYLTYILLNGQRRGDFDLLRYLYK